MRSAEVLTVFALISDVRIHAKVILNTFPFCIVRVSYNDIQIQQILRMAVFFGLNAMDIFTCSWFVCQERVMLVMSCVKQSSETRVRRDEEQEVVVSDSVDCP